MTTVEEEDLRLRKITEDVAAWAASAEGQTEIAAAHARARKTAEPFHRARRIRPEWLRTPCTR